jgi:hypothetical protein
MADFDKYVYGNTSKRRLDMDSAARADSCSADPEALTSANSLIGAVRQTAEFHQLSFC